MLLQQTAARDTILANGAAMAIRSLWLLTWREARTLTYADAFVAVGLCFVPATMMVPLLRKVAPPKAPVADGH